ncbi:MAG: hypothetical protein A2539_10050 [Elusimicrobia bacterium RIFOXYD2_FULL_34_15]|nr:MAG: hypothetical protein A2539_10050 [Elusimicrobia bacterium RIFOXYD2_FULL_34_15]
MKIINRYLIKEFIPKFLTSLLVFTFILLMDLLFDLSDLLLNKGAGLINTIKLFIYILPSFFMFTMPMSILSGTILLFSRLSEDNEILAIRTSGIKILTIIKPIITISLFLSLIMFYFNSSLIPILNSKFKTLYYQILYKNPIMQFSEKNFVQIQNYDIYVKKISKNNILKKIIIYKWKDDLPTITTAERAEMTVAEDKGILFRLYNGKILQENPKKSGEFNLCNFSENEMFLEIIQNTDFLANREGGMRELKSKELLNKARTGSPEFKNFYLTEFHLRNVLASAGLIFVFVAVPLSISFTKKRTKSLGITNVIIIMFIYYIILVTGTTLGKRGAINPMIAVWIPNIIVGFTGILLLLNISKK